MNTLADYQESVSYVAEHTESDSDEEMEQLASLGLGGSTA